MVELHSSTTIAFTLWPLPFVMMFLLHLLLLSKPTVDSTTTRVLSEWNTGWHCHRPRRRQSCWEWGEHFSILSKWRAFIDIIHFAFNAALGVVFGVAPAGRELRSRKLADWRTLLSCNLWINYYQKERCKEWISSNCLRKYSSWFFSCLGSKSSSLLLLFLCIYTCVCVYPLRLENLTPFFS